MRRPGIPTVAQAVSLCVEDTATILLKRHVLQATRSYRSHAIKDTTCAVKDAYPRLVIVATKRAALHAKWARYVARTVPDVCLSAPHHAVGISSVPLAKCAAMVEPTAANMKNIYRCTIFLTEEKYKTTPPSNIFLKAESRELAAKGAAQLYDQALVANGRPKTQVRIDVIESSNEEAELYAAAMKSRQTTNRSMN